MDYAVFLLVAASTSALVAAVVLSLFALPWQAPRPGRVAVGWVIGVASAFLVGVRLLPDFRLHWPPSEVLDRFLLVLLPVAVLVELLAAALGSRWWLIWPLRLIVAAGAARILLHDSAYLTNPRAIDWSPEQVQAALVVLPMLLAATWIGLATLTRAAPGSSVPFALAMTCGCAGMTIMLSSYLTGGPLGLVLAGALVGATMIALFLPLPRDIAPALGIGIVGLFALLVAGHYFAALTAVHALTILLAPLLCWLPELPYLRKLGPRWRGLLRIVLVAIPLTVVVVQAQAKFIEDSAAGSGSGGSEEDAYRNYGK
jgi:hypothetical protein